MIFRKDEIIKLCLRKKVLHLGFIQHSDLYEQKIAANDWLHEKISKVASSLVGIDYLKRDVDIISKKYKYACYCVDVTNKANMEALSINLGAFDVIVCGELIEHVGNPGLMLNNIKQFMGEKSIVIITTPNPWSRERVALIKRGILESKWLNREHVAWYTYKTLQQLLDREGFSEYSYDYYIAETKKQFFNGGKIMNKIKKILKSNEFFLPKHMYDGLFFVARIKD